MNSRRRPLHRRRVPWALACGLLLITDAWAEEAPATPPAAETITSRVEMSQAMVSESLDAFARKMDAYFYDERFVAEDAATRLRLGEYVFNEEGRAARWHTRFNLSFKLPSLDRKVKLFFGSDETDNVTVDAPTLSQSITSQSNDSLAGLRFYAKASEKLNLSLALGVKVDGADLFAGPRLRYTRPLGDWLGRFTQRVIWITQRGWESSTRFDLERGFSSRMLLRYTFDGRWRQEDPGYRFEIGATLFHQLPESIVMAYGWVHRFRTRPKYQYNESVISVQFRRHIWRNWLYLGITPQLAFYDDKDFNPTAGISFGLDVIFGSK